MLCEANGDQMKIYADFFGENFKVYIVVTLRSSRFRINNSFLLITDNIQTLERF